MTEFKDERLERIKAVANTPFRLFYQTPELSMDDIQWLICEVERMKKQLSMQSTNIEKVRKANREERDELRRQLQQERTK